MHTDILELRDFYMSALGKATRATLRKFLSKIWPDLQAESICVLGYGMPLMRPWLQNIKKLFAIMPAQQGVAFWPKEGPNITCLADIVNLPLADCSVERAVVIHILEQAGDNAEFLREVWRILQANGRAIFIVPNRKGFWAHSELTPFGFGRPYSARQLKQALSNNGFLVDRVWHALYMPPASFRFILKFSEFFEKIGETLFPAFGGVVIVEASKQIYAPAVSSGTQLRHRLVLPLPIPLPQKIENDQLLHTVNTEDDKGHSKI